MGNTPFVRRSLRIIRTFVVPFVATAILITLIGLDYYYWHNFLNSLSLSPRARYWTHAGPGGSLLGLLPATIAWILVGKYLFRMPLKEQFGGRLRMTLRDWRIGIPIAVAFTLVIVSGAAIGGDPIYWSYNWRSPVVNCFSNLYEEILVRGLLLQLTARYWGRLPAMAWTSCAFGLMHGTGEKAIFIALTTWVFAWAVLKSRSLWTSWVIHQGIDMMGDPFLH